MRIFHLWMVWTLTVILTACSSPSDKKADTGNAAAQLVSFEASPAEVIAGDPVILSWDAKNVVLARLEDGAGKVLLESKQPTGTFTIVPESSGLYRLIVRGRDGKELQQQVAVQTRAGEGPAAQFRVEPAEVPVGDPIRLVWETSDTHSVVIRSGGALVYESDRLLSGAVEIIAEKAAVYTLTAKGPFGQRELAAEVKVKPVILSFTGGSSTPVAKGTQTSLSWRTRGADELELRTPEGQSWQIAAEDIEVGSIVVPMSESGRFELVARKGGFETVQGQEIAILGAPRISFLQASPAVITEGERFTVTVAWEVDWALDGILSWDGNTYPIDWMQIRKGWLDIEMSTATQVRLETRSSQASSSATFQVTTIPEPEPVLSGPRHVAVNEPFVLEWVAPGAVEVFLFRDNVPVDVPSDVVSGQIEQQIGRTTTWRLDARNDVGSVRSATWVVDIGAPRIASFDSNQPRYGSGRPMVLSWVVDGGTRLAIHDAEGVAVPGCTLVEGGGLKGSCTATAPTELGTYVYTLEVENGEGIDTRTLSFRVGEDHSLEWFAGSGDYVTAGTDFTLSWLVLDDVDGGPVTISITDNRGGSWQFPGTHTETGSMKVLAGAPGEWRFRLVAAVAGKPPLEAELIVTVEGVPELSAVPSSDHYHLQVREPVVMEWTTLHATKVEIFVVDAAGALVEPPLYRTGSPAEAAHGSLDLRPNWPRQSFEVVASNRGGSTTRARFDFEVLGEPMGVLWFDVSAATVSPGSSVTLEWGTQGSATLAPFYDTPLEVTATAPFINIRPTGTALPMVRCEAGYEPDDEGCNVIPFANGFTFPFDGQELPGVTAFVNGLMSARMAVDHGNSYSAMAYPESSRLYSNFGIYWRDQFLESLSETIRYESRNGPLGRHYIVQWTNITLGGTYQAVFWESGGLDYRYSNDMFTGGSGAVIGWQDTDATRGHVLNTTDSTDVAGGLNNRSWRYFEKPQADTGTLTVTVDRTTIFTLCGVGPLGRDCERRTVTVQ